MYIKKLNEIKEKGKEGRKQKLNNVAIWKFRKG
jgi:hypothetical protein